MQWQFFATLLILNTIMAFGVAWALVKHKIRKPGSKMMKWLFVALGVWTLFYAMITLSQTLEAKIFWLKMENIGIVMTPPFWLLFTLCYTKQNKWVNKFIFFLFFSVPTMTLIFLFSGVWFDLYYTNVEPIEGMLSPLRVTGGTWYYVQFAHSYLLLGTGLFILLKHLVIFRDIYRKRVLTLLAAFIIPVLFNLFYHMGGQIFPSIDLPVDWAPVSFTLTASLLSFAIFGQKLFDTTPISRYLLLDSIVEIVLVVDMDDHVLDANQAAADWLEMTIEKIIGKKVAGVLSDYPTIIRHYENSKKNEQPFHLFSDTDLMIEMTISPIHDQNGSAEGYVLVLHDIAEQRQMEKDLKKANRELKAKLYEIEMLQAQLKEQAIRDPLTGLYNRRYLAEALDREIAHAERENLPLSVIIMDIDHFKEFNDRYGHKCGDLVLEYLGEMMLSNTRRGDTVCRYGGEEFVILMPMVGIDIAQARAESWRKRFADAVIEYDGLGLRTQFSAGVACYPDGVKNGEDLLKAADQALYYSKAHGRNCVTTYPLNGSNEENYD